MDKPTNALRVIIEGQAGAGKTTLALKIKALLEAEGATNVTIDDDDINLGTSYEYLQAQRWDAIKADRTIEVETVQTRPNVNKLTDARVEGLVVGTVVTPGIDIARFVVESPVTGNACHMISEPASGLVWVSDLDSGEVYSVDFGMLCNCKVLRLVIGDDFGFSWCAGSEHLSDKVYEHVMEMNCD